MRLKQKNADFQPQNPLESRSKRFVVPTLYTPCVAPFWKILLTQYFQKLILCDDFECFFEIPYQFRTINQISYFERQQANTESETSLTGLLKILQISSCLSTKL